MNIQEIAMPTPSAAPAAQTAAVSDEPAAVCINRLQSCLQYVNKQEIGKTKGENRLQCEIGIL